MVENQSFMNSNGGISFEFIPRIAYNNPNGLTNVSAIANYDIRSSALNKLFYFQLTNPLLIDLSNTDIGINNDLEILSIITNLVKDMDYLNVATTKISFLVNLNALELTIKLLHRGLQNYL